MLRSAWSRGRSCTFVCDEGSTVWRAAVDNHCPSQLFGRDRRQHLNDARRAPLPDDVQDDSRPRARRSDRDEEGGQPRRGLGVPPKRLAHHEQRVIAQPAEPWLRPVLEVNQCPKQVRRNGHDAPASSLPRQHSPRRPPPGARLGAHVPHDRPGACRSIEAIDEPRHEWPLDQPDSQAMAMRRKRAGDVSRTAVLAKEAGGEAASWMTVDDPNRREPLTAQKRRGPHASWKPGSPGHVARLEPLRRTDLTEVEIRAEIRMPQRRQRGAQIGQLTARARIDRAHADDGPSTGRKIDVRAVSASGKPQRDERQRIGHAGSRCKTRRGGACRDRSRIGIGRPGRAGSVTFERRANARHAHPGAAERPDVAESSYRMLRLCCDFSPLASRTAKRS